MVMRVKKAWKKSKRREMGHTLGRFLAILAIVALGVGVLVAALWNRV